MKIQLDKKKIENLALSSGGKVIAKMIKAKVIPAEQASRKKLLMQFKSHPISKEIEYGPNSPNISGLLGGYGNLFSFFGFYENDSPLADIEAYFQRPPKIDVYQTPIRKIFGVKIDGPRMGDIYKMTTLPWLKTTSWVRMITDGLVGFEYYLFTNYAPSSRSSTAIQTEDGILGGERGSRGTKTDPYLIDLISEYYSSIKDLL